MYSNINEFSNKVDLSRKETRSEWMNFASQIDKELGHNNSNSLLNSLQKYFLSFHPQKFKLYPDEVNPYSNDLMQKGLSIRKYISGLSGDDYFSFMKSMLFDVEREITGDMSSNQDLDNIFREFKYADFDDDNKDFHILAYCPGNINPNEYGKNSSDVKEQLKKMCKMCKMNDPLLFALLFYQDVGNVRRHHAVVFSKTTFYYCENYDRYFLLRKSWNCEYGMQLKDKIDGELKKEVEKIYYRLHNSYSDTTDVISQLNINIKNSIKDQLNKIIYDGKPITINIK